MNPSRQFAKGSPVDDRLTHHDPHPRGNFKFGGAEVDLPVPKDDRMLATVLVAGAGLALAALTVYLLNRERLDMQE